MTTAWSIDHLPSRASNTLIQSHHVPLGDSDSPPGHEGPRDVAYVMGRGGLGREEEGIKIRN